MAVSVQNRRLRVLSHRLLEIQESERRQIACELHDKVGQALTALRLNLEVLRPRVSGPPERLDESVTIVDRLFEQIRTLSFDLRPLILDDLGLVAALQWHVEREVRRGGFTATLTTEGPDTRWPTDVETACFRLAQEALTNIARYAHARHVNIELRRGAKELELCIRDNGVGFDVAAARRAAVRGRRVGLLWMEEVVRLAGGSMTLESSPGRGGAVRARFPL